MALFTRSSSTHVRRRLGAILLGGFLLLAPLGVEASAGNTEGDAVSAVEAKDRLSTLAGYLRHSSSTNAEVNAALDDVAEAYRTVGPDAKTRDGFRKKADPLLVKALLRWKTARGTEKPNVQEDSAVHAAMTLRALAPSLDARARKSLTNRVRGVIDHLVDSDNRDGISQKQLDATFAVVGALRGAGSLAWIEKNFLTTNLLDLPVLVAAHKALAMFGDAPGKARHSVVDRLIRIYVGVETLAAQGNTPRERSAKALWDELKLHTIPAVRALTGTPTTDTGEALATIKAFQHWWSDHKKRTDPVWRAPKKASSKTAAPKK